MEPRNVIMWILLPVLVILVMSAGVQAQKFREVPASEILEKIQAGEDVNYRNVRITGEFNLSKIELETVPTAREEWQIEYWGVEEELKIVESKIIIINSIFGNTTDFSNAQFKKPVDFHGLPGTSSLGISDFRGASFDGGADFGHVRFSDGADFEHASFGGYANFRDTSFDGGADFQGACFDGYANFWGARFSGDADFRDVSFGGCADFGDKTLLDNVRYCGARVIGRPYFFGGSRFIHDPYFFNGARFIGNVSFTDASFSDDADFRGVSFSSYADFNGASFSDGADFQSVRFSCDAEFRGASFDSDADFWGVSFDGDAIFNSAEFNNVILSDTTFTNVSLHGIDFKSMEVEWSSLKDALVFDGPTYIKLIKNFREMEQFGAADDAYYQYRQLSQENKKWSLSKFGDVFMWLSCGYGVRPWYAAVWTVAITFMWALFYWLGNGIIRSKDSDEGDKQDVFLCDAFYFIMGAFTTVCLMLLFLDCGLKLHYIIILVVAMILIYIRHRYKLCFFCWQSQNDVTYKQGRKFLLTLRFRGLKKLNLWWCGVYRLENNIGKKGASFCDAFYFSVVTFTTVGYGDWYPKNRYRILAVIEGLAGWLTLALFLVTLANVMIRP